MALELTKAQLEKVRKSGRRSCANEKAIQSIIDNPGVWEELRKYVTADQLVTIVSHDGGSLNLRAFRALLVDRDALKYLYDELGMTVAQLVAVVSHIGGSHNLKALLDNRDVLKELCVGLGMTVAQLVAVVSHGGGSHNLKALLDNRDTLKGLCAELGMTAAQLVSVVSHIGGSHNLKALVDNRDDLKGLCTELDMTVAQLVAVVSHGGGSHNLKALLDNRDALKDLCVGLSMTAAQLVAVVSHGGGSHNLKALVDNRDVLKELCVGLGMTAAQLVAVVSHAGGARSLNALETLVKDEKAMDHVRALGLDKPAFAALLIKLGQQKASAGKLHALRRCLIQEASVARLSTSEALRDAFFTWVKKHAVSGMSIVMFLRLFPSTESALTRDGFNAFLCSITGSNKELKKNYPGEFAAATKMIKTWGQASSAPRAPKRPRDEPDSASAGTSSSSSSAASAAAAGAGHSPPPSRLPFGDSIAIAGDGNCLFRAVAHFFPGETHESLRERAVESLRTSDILEEAVFTDARIRGPSGVHVTHSRDDYLSHIAQPRHYGGELELRVLADSLKRTIVVLMERDIGASWTYITYGPEYRMSAAPVVVTYRGSNHYDAVDIPSEQRTAFNQAAFPEAGASMSSSSSSSSSLAAAITESVVTQPTVDDSVVSGERLWAPVSKRARTEQGPAASLPCSSSSAAAITELVAMQSALDDDSTELPSFACSGAAGNNLFPPVCATMHRSSSSSSLGSASSILEYLRRDLPCWSELKDPQDTTVGSSSVGFFSQAASEREDTGRQKGQMPSPDDLLRLGT